MILGTVAAAGLLSAALVAPGVLTAITKLGLIPKRRQADIIRRSQYKLIDDGLLEWKNKRLCLTLKGERKLRSLEMHNFQFKRPTRWDGRWRVLIFDIPEHRKSVRNRIRTTLQAVGFIRLQDSVWIFPYDCEDLINLFKADFKVGKDMLYMIVDTLEYDTPMRARFGLQ